jgi:hypothetical protein
MNHIDINQARAIDGHAGGDYTPSAPIVIEGAGVEFGAPSTATAPFDFTSVVTTGPGPVLIGARLRFKLQMGPDADATIEPDAGNIVRVVTLTASRSYTLGTGGIGAGDWVLLHNFNGTYTISVNGSFSAGPNTASLFYHTGSAWTRMFAV